MADKKLKVACLCGKLIGFQICQFLMEQEIDLKIVVNDYEKPGEWYQTPRSLDVEEISLEEIPAFSPELIVVAFYDTILKEKIYSLPKSGCWNLHLGDTLRYRGAYPNIRAIENGDREYKVTLHQIDSGIDSGPILAQKSFPIDSADCGKRVYEKMTKAGLELFMECYSKLVTGEALSLAEPQNQADASLYFRKDFSRELTVPAELQNQVLARTFPPFPPPYFMVGDRKFIITEEQDNPHNH